MSVGIVPPRVGVCMRLCVFVGAREVCVHLSFVILHGSVHKSDYHKILLKIDF